MMPKCKFPGCKCTATKGSEYCAKHDMAAMCAIMEAQKIEHPEPIEPPAWIHDAVRKTIKQEAES